MLMINNPTMSIGRRIKAARLEKKMSQQALADKIGIKQPTLSELETGESFSSSLIGSFAAALGKSALWLETGKGPEDAPAVTSSADMDSLVQLIILYRDSSVEGRSLILDAAKAAGKGI
jgi:transcriptional regulator with XRE-family HTH domain